MSDEAPDIVKTPEAARILGMTETTLVKAANDGQVPCWKTPGGHRRFSRSALEALKNEPAKAAAS